MSELKKAPEPLIIAGFEVPKHGGFRIDQAKTILADIHEYISESELVKTDAIIAYLNRQGINSAEQIEQLRKTLRIPITRRGSQFTEEDKTIISSFTDIIGRMNSPKNIPYEDLGARDTSIDQKHGRFLR